MGQWMFTHLLPWICRSGFGEGPRPVNCTSLYDLKVTNLLAPRNSLAIDDTLKREISVVTLSWLGERNIRDVTWSVGHCTVIILLQPCVQTFGTGEAGLVSLSDILYFPFSFLLFFFLYFTFLFLLLYPFPFNRLNFVCESCRILLSRTLLPRWPSFLGQAEPNEPSF